MLASKLRNYYQPILWNWELFLVQSVVAWWCQCGVVWCAWPAMTGDMCQLQFPAVMHCQLLHITTQLQLQHDQPWLQRMFKHWRPSSNICASSVISCRKWDIGLHPTPYSHVYMFLFTCVKTSAICQTQCLRLLKKVLKIFLKSVAMCWTIMIWIWVLFNQKTPE